MMKPWRYPHLFTLWQTWLDEGQSHQLDHWLAAWFKRHKQYGKKDRKAYADAMFTAMRFIPFAIAIEKEFSGESHSLERFPVAAFWYWVLLRKEADTIAPRELQDASQRTEFYTECAESWPQQGALTPQFLQWYGLHADLAPALEARAKAEHWPDESLRHFIRQQTENAPLWLRPQGLNATLAKAELAESGIEAEIINGGLKLTANPNLSQLAVYQQGLVEVQDYASQQLAKVIQPKANETVWDVCAGAGGKSLAIAAQHPVCHITASDLRTNALNQLTQRAQRANVTNITAKQHDACQPFTGNFDWVFIDAPCSSTGVWRRSPDAKYRLQPDAPLLALQQTILNNAAAHVKTGGTLVYASCSWRTEENEAQITQFIESNPQFTLEEQRSVGLPEVDADIMWYAKLRKS